MDELAVIAEFDGDKDAVERLMRAAFYGNLDHVAEVLRQARAEQAEHQRIRGEFEAAGHTIGEILPPNGQYLTVLCYDDQDLSPAAHADCPGRGVLFRSWDLLVPVHYCADPNQYGHTFRNARQDHVAAAGDPAHLGRTAAGRNRPNRIPADGWSSGATGSGRPRVRCASGGWPAICSAGGRRRGRWPVHRPAAAGHAGPAAHQAAHRPFDGQLRRDYRPVRSGLG